MPLSHLPVRLYLSVEPLDPLCRPAVAARLNGALLLMVDPHTTVPDLVDWVAVYLDVREVNGYRHAFGQPPVGEPLDDWLYDSTMGELEVPEALRLPAAAYLWQEAEGA